MEVNLSKACEAPCQSLNRVPDGLMDNSEAIAQV